MEYPHLLYSSFMAAREQNDLMAIHYVPQRTPSTTTIAPPTGRQEGLYTRDLLPSGCERVGIYIRCTADGLARGSVKALSIPYTNNKNNNDSGDHKLTQLNASATPYRHSTTTLPLSDATPAIDNCATPTGMDRLACASPDVTIGLFSLLLFLMVLLCIAGWLILRSPNKLKDEEKAIELRPRLDQYQSASKLRLKEKVRSTGRPDKVVQSSKENVADDVSESYSARSIPYLPGWTTAKIREKKEDLARVLAKELPQGADVPTGW